ncbi:uncharacterized protein F4822DRAFT_355509 [Hypoxylon trugodes]|uniref:uncharacterized protein n=1 Tax=Hypoxylon trugodes TaxID=326681 RepID=UPI00219057C0|nr:uncharacterized protein F4822DRAFT_355509 [Hypoxylon trugodes]KAI1385820.1 hypothetical protein F4822DRAFT_355509 [Hypoxylon trugodes]
MSGPPVVRIVRSGAKPTSLWPSRPAWSETLSRLTNSRNLRRPKLRLSPSRVLALRLRSKTDTLKRAYRRPFEFAIKQRADRLPLLLFQAWLARQDIRNEPRLFQSLTSVSPSEWADRFHDLALRGWSRQDLDHWIWVISGEDGDIRVQRLISTDTPKPMFLVMVLARSDERFRKPESLLFLMEYTSKHYFNSTAQPSDDKDTVFPGRKMAMTINQFLLFLPRLVRHIMRLCPRAIVAVARFTVHYIQQIPSENNPKGYHEKCEVFNAALQLFKQPAATQPFGNMEFNWRAQRLLLAMSDNLDRALIINKASYRAVREVMVGLKKSQSERAVAVRYSKSWPPYRQDFDGLDAKRTPEDDHSRSVKAGVHMKEAGYPYDHYDHALDALGGIGGNSPTIQTRGLPPKEWKDDKADQNLYSLWAARIRATRNHQEAWKVFNQFLSKTGKSPNIQIYTEMFVKLQSRLISPESTALPGDSRENFPVHDGNYSEYELARLSPLTVSELYDQMINSGIKPEGYCLRTLLTNANSLEEASRYLRDSGISPTTVSSIGLFKQPSYQALREIPLRVFESYIQLLCKLHPSRRGRDKIPSVELLRIQHAIKLVKLRLRPGTTEGSTFRPPWSFILWTLARQHLCVLNGSWVNNNVEVLSKATDIIQHVQKTVGVDQNMLLYYCRIIEKAAISRLVSAELTSGGSGIRDTSPLVPSVNTVLDILKSMFSHITEPTGTAWTKSDKLEVPQFMHSFDPVHLHNYMRTLGFLEDVQGMKELLEWMLTHRAYLNEEVEQIGERGRTLIVRTLCAFQAFAGPSLEHGEQNDIILRTETKTEEASFWRWPTPEEVDSYVQSDTRGGSQRLQQKILAKVWSQQHTAEREQAIMASA